MRSLTRLEGDLIVLEIGEVEDDAEGLPHEHGEGLHVGMEELLMMAALVHVLRTHQLVGWVGKTVPKVEIVPQIRKIVTAEAFAPNAWPML